ncbi:MAG: MBL fold metallo-hydrolase [Clostridia bacterium]|nr:MBL fold metallo-hydrolase [Clostridia bacterium]MDD4798212.1 MBL fold metallo-hydrolase [Clostridia bacterium]
MNECNLVHFYGVRGSFPTYDNGKIIFGGNTSCCHLQMGSRALVFDCGTGAVKLGQKLVSDAKSKQIDLLISHIHFDHILGMFFFDPLKRQDFTVNIYSEDRAGMGIREQLDRIMQHPQWPVNTDGFKAQVNYHTITANAKFDLGDGLSITTMRSNHPDISTVFRLDYGKKSFVYTLDYEHDKDSFAELVGLCKKADFVVYDASFTDEEYQERKGWGHSTWQKGVELAKLSGAKQVAMAHLPFNKTDEQLLALDEQVRAESSRCFLAREGAIYKL